MLTRPATSSSRVTSVLDRQRLRAGAAAFLGRRFDLGFAAACDLHGCGALLRHFACGGAADACCRLR